MCLSESTLLSLSSHADGNLVGLGYTRFLNLFAPYFKRIERIESARWLHLFSETASSPRWNRIAFIGKDREGHLRKRWSALSIKPLLFVEMYPGETSGARPDLTAQASGGHMHVEDFQLLQLPGQGLTPRKKEILLNQSPRVILYPEPDIAKRKWHHGNFIDLYRLLKEKGVDVLILEPLGFNIDSAHKVSFQELTEVRDYFAGGGIFVSNDSGMAHLAGACGLFTITIFHEFDPLVWQPRGYGIALREGNDVINPEAMASRILGLL